MDSKCWRFTSSPFKKGASNTDDYWSWAQHWARKHWEQRRLCLQHARLFYTLLGLWCESFFFFFLKEGGVWGAWLLVYVCCMHLCPIGHSNHLSLQWLHFHGDFMRWLWLMYNNCTAPLYSSGLSWDSLLLFSVFKVVLWWYLDCWFNNTLIAVDVLS